MPNTTRPQWTEEGLKKRITGCTLKIGEARRNGDESTANTLRERRYVAIGKLAEKFRIFTLVNPEGKTEFVDRAEWEQRMIAWGRRTGQIARPRVSLSDRPAAPPTAEPPSAGSPPIVPPPADPLPPEAGN